MERLLLHVPFFEELSYRQRLLSDPETMAYDRGYEAFDGYHSDTGCIDFPESAWRDWYDWFVGAEPERWYAYIVRRADGAFLGEVNLRRAPRSAHYDMGIVLEARYRGQGYAEEALRLLLAQAFEALGAEEVRNRFEETRIAALRTHLACGFRETGRDKGLVALRITRDAYDRRKSASAED
ncbi:MAG: GNAT family N-acetyltransferase [Oscillospiraceae bacterium]|nr:GNAT family N-acetyltransferase [Oscillospiraceae bacterium]